MSGICHCWKAGGLCLLKRDVSNSNSLSLHRKEAFTCWNTASGARALNYGTRLDLILAAGPNPAPSNVPLPPLSGTESGGEQQQPSQGLVSPSSGHRTLPGPTDLGEAAQQQWLNSNDGGAGVVMGACESTVVEGDALNLQSSGACAMGGFGQGKEGEVGGEGGASEDVKSDQADQGEDEGGGGEGEEGDEEACTVPCVSQGPAVVKGAEALKAVQSWVVYSVSAPDLTV